MDGLAMATTAGRMALTLSIFMLQGLRRLFLCLLLGFELLFVFRSLFDLLSGGFEKMVGWWWHLQMASSLSGRVFSYFHWGRFFIEETLLLALLWGLWFFEGRSRRGLGRYVAAA
jgi:hypothetical protein